MTLGTLIPLAGLALVDSTSFGTLGIPLWLMLRPRIRIRTFAIFLGTICLFYWALGLALTLGATTIAQALKGLGGIPYITHAQLVVGVALVAVSFLFDGKSATRRRERRAARPTSAPSRHDRWKARLADGDVPTAVIVTVALGAGLVEAASMLPYLAAVGIITQANPGPVGTALVLMGYVLVMALPAAVLLVLRLTAHRAIEPLLRRINAWIEKNADDMLGWILGIVGFLLAADAASTLGLFHFYAQQ